MNNKPEHTADISAELRTLSRGAECCELQPKVFGKPIAQYLAELADRLDAANKRELATTKESLEVGNAAKLPDGWKMYDKYQIRHTDGTPLKGKRYFVLRLDSDDPLEAARVAAAMSAYKGETPQGNAAKLLEVVKCLMDNLNIHLMQPSELITVNRAELEGMVMVCEKALAAPSRNCDMYGGDFKMMNKAKTGSKA